MLLLQNPLGWLSFILPFALVLPAQGPLVVFFHLFKSLYALILFPGLFLYLLQFPGCIVEVQIYIILIGRNFFREQFSIIHSKGHENITLFWTSNLTSENLSQGDKFLKKIIWLLPLDTMEAVNDTKLSSH